MSNGGLKQNHFKIPTKIIEPEDVVIDMVSCDTDRRASPMLSPRTLKSQPPSFSQNNYDMQVKKTKPYTNGKISDEES